MTLKWIPDPDEVWPAEDEAQLGMSGEVTVADIRRSKSGRYHWEVVALPGVSGYRDERHGWCENEAEAKHTVERRWTAWLDKASLRPMTEMSLLEHRDLAGNLIGLVEVNS